VAHGGRGGGSGAGTTRAWGRRAAVGTVLPLEPDAGEVCGEASGWAQGHWAGRRWFYSDSNQVQTNSNSIQFVSNLTDPKRTFSNSKNLKQNIVVNVLNKGTTFSIGISSDSKWISNEKSVKLLD
jgi:hypothetical protein